MFSPCHVRAGQETAPPYQRRQKRAWNLQAGQKTSAWNDGGKLNIDLVREFDTNLKYEASAAAPFILRFCPGKRLSFDRNKSLRLFQPRRKLQIPYSWDGFEDISTINRNSYVLPALRALCIPCACCFRFGA